MLLFAGGVAIILGFMQMLFSIFTLNPDIENRRIKSGINYLACGVIILFIFDNFFNSNGWKINMFYFQR